MDGQWMGKSYFEPAQGRRGRDALLSFTSQDLVVTSDGRSLTVTTGGANWTFRNCSQN
jgi:hypothetical protein